MSTYYKIGISGHRDLKPSQKEENLCILQGCLLKIKRNNPDTELLILSPVADGADRLILEVALALDIKYDIILPMPKDIYAQDFSENSQEEFEFFLTYAHSIQTIDLYAGNTLELISKPSLFRDFQYRQAGRRIVDLADEMIIMSDGVKNDKMGGTEDIVKYANMCGIVSHQVRCDRLSA